MRVLCFGDSNTWGYCPKTGKRYESPWPRILQNLAPELDIYIDASPGRTTCLDGAHQEQINGLQDLQSRWQRQQFDRVLVMLGTNDLQARFKSSVLEVVERLQRYVQWIGRERTVLVAPVAIQEVGMFGQMFHGATSKSLQLAGAIESLAQQLGCGFIDANAFVASNGIDGVHWLPDDHEVFAQGVARYLQGYWQQRA
ncbi:GDSL-type esterase/lipase family protein [Salinibius halmophilus]|uniref:GDSL-type esterase/lipase family protein n=1 Tax=Salinibius halmophilus TaxID=1853216 RepID=UPI000E662621|nr:GDSL-type esterase/lipase family protein [Salinibius halmophilus]